MAGRRGKGDPGVVVSEGDWSGIGVMGAGWCGGGALGAWRMKRGGGREGRRDGGMEGGRGWIAIGVGDLRIEIFGEGIMTRKGRRE